MADTILLSHSSNAIFPEYSRVHVGDTEHARYFCSHCSHIIRFGTASRICACGRMLMEPEACDDTDWDLVKHMFIETLEQAEARFQRSLGALKAAGVSEQVAPESFRRILALMLLQTEPSERSNVRPSTSMAHMGCDI